MPDQIPSRVTKSDQVLVQHLNDEMVLLNLDGEQYFSLDPIGASMWTALEENDDVETAVQQLLEEYEVDEATLRSDLSELMSKLLESGLLLSVN